MFIDLCLFQWDFATLDITCAFLNAHLQKLKLKFDRSMWENCPRTLLALRLLNDALTERCKKVSVVISLIVVKA